MKRIAAVAVGMLAIGSAVAQDRESRSPAAGRGAERAAAPPAMMGASSFGGGMGGMGGMMFPSVGDGTFRPVRTHVTIAEAGELLDTSHAEKVAARVLQMQKEGKLTSFAVFEIVTLSGQVGKAQIGGERAVTTSRATVPAGFGGPGDRRTTTTRSNTMRAVGTQVSVTPSVQEDGSLLVLLSVEQSRLLNRSPSTPPQSGENEMGTDPDASAGIRQMSTNATLRLTSGKPAVAASLIATEDGKTATTVILIVATSADSPTSGAALQPATDEAAATAESAADEAAENPLTTNMVSDVIPLKNLRAASLSKELRNPPKFLGLTVTVNEKQNAITISGLPFRVTAFRALVEKRESESSRESNAEAN